MRGDIAPGTKLNIRALREQFAVSLSPLREALSRLAAEGLIEAIDQRGYRVTRLSLRNLNEVIAMRQELEGLALRESISRRDKAWLEGISAAHEALLRQERSRHFRVEEWEIAHRAFHDALIAGADMPLLLATCNGLHDRSDRYRRVFLSRQPKDRKVVDEHAAILKAALEKNSEEAVNLLKAHIKRTGTNVSKEIAELEDEQPASGIAAT
ncbi:GntR family transcriptional regulator [Novosphingobium terrae]|uniref:GntR family transcriptional regulator n=1 Tax=Novosphingobium terrae TaxID=2726189 RepID=UPI001F142A92|nr:GntR family transcriptional regulator [Novosphingobium terrae]